MTANDSPALDALSDQLQEHGQEHVLRYWDELDTTQQRKLATQIQTLDLDQLDMLISGQDAKPDFAAMARRATAPPSVGADGSGVPWSITEAQEAGTAALRQGKLAALLAAGGQGTRLGFDEPKGMYPIGPVSSRTLFQIFADRLAAVSHRYNVSVPLLVMTSDATDETTRKYFEENDYLGLPRDSVRIFKQGTMPAVDHESGKLLLASRDSLALSPDGHGGTVAALQRSGAMKDLLQKGVEHLFYFQVDNPLVQLLDPSLIGHHLLAESELTTQVVRKRYPTERVGNVVTVDDHLQIIEYSDLPESSAKQTNDDGSLRLWAGNIAVHVISMDFLQRICQSSSALPFHRAHKKVAHLDVEGQLVSPTEANATKFEKFIFDLLPEAKNGIVVEVEPAKAFAPVKNADGSENDTPQLAKSAISQLHRDWLISAGAQVDQGVTVEISPHFALDENDLQNRLPSGLNLTEDRFFDTPLP